VPGSCPGSFGVLLDEPRQTGESTPTVLRRIYAHYGGYLPEDMTMNTFEAKLRIWQDHGRKYAFIAGHIGAGSILHLRSVLPHTQLKTMSKGGEHAVDGVGSSEAAFSHQRSLGLPALSITSGADGMMHNLLWEVFDSFLDFPKREGESPFPGFADDGSTEQAETSIMSGSCSPGSPCD